MAEKIKMLEKPRGLMKLLNYVPGLIYRIGVTKSIEGRMMVITTTGRNSGKKVPAVVNYLKKDNKVYAFSIYKGSDWLKNIEKNPQVEIQIGKEKMKTNALIVGDSEEKAEAFQVFIDKIGKSGAERFYQVKPDMNKEEVRSIAIQMPTIRFKAEK